MLNDAPVMAELLRVSRDFLAPWDPIRSDDYFTAGGQLAVIRDTLARHQEGSTLPHVILDDIAGQWQDCILYQVINDGA